MRSHSISSYGLGYLPGVSFCCKIGSLTNATEAEENLVTAQLPNNGALEGNSPITGISFFTDADCSSTCSAGCLSFTS